MSPIDLSDPIEFDSRDLDVRWMIAALERGDFELHYQPQVGIGGGAVLGAEALLRWRHPSRGLLAGPRMVPTLRDLRFARQVGEWALWCAQRDIESWREAGVRPVPVAVNIHPEHLLDPKFAPMLMDASDGMIDVEIVQSSECCDLALLPALETLREAGVRVSLEDFSLGYGALGRLAELPIDIVKIDRWTVARLSRSAAPVQRARTRRLLSTLVSMARLCRFITIAKGVETSFELEALTELGCAQFQGYLHSPAVSADRFAQFLAPALPAQAVGE